jgi:hypothetical protein
MIPININEQRLHHFALTLNCQTGSLPFTYLGLPLGLTKPSIKHFLPMVQRVQRILCGIADFMNYGGKLLMVKSVLASLPIFFMCCLDVPVTIKEHVQKYMRHCLWRKKTNDVQAGGSALVAWKKICRPKQQGGLGVLNLDLQNKTLLLKNVHKLFNREDTPWVNLIWNSYYASGAVPGQRLVGSFWWRAHLKLLDSYKALARCNIGDGKSVFFWGDLWNDQCLHQKFPHLITFAKKTNISVNEAVLTEYTEDLFNLPLSQEAFEEFNDLEIICQEAMEKVLSDGKDTWSYIWGNSEFSSQKAYKALIGVQPAVPLFSWIWKSSCQAKHKFFFWLLLNDRLNTRNLLGRKKMVLQSYNCATLECNREETLQHLFLTCPFAEECWNFISPSRQRNLSVNEALQDLKCSLNLPFSMDIIILASWALWMTRNNKIFRGQNASFQGWKAIYMEELKLLAHRMKKKHKACYVSWLNSVL